MTPRSGTPYDLVAGRSTAAISGTGATLRTLELDGTEVLDGFVDDQLSPGGAGQVLSPWPNRLADGTYVFDGTSATVPLNEPERKNAIHGLVRWREWQPTAVTPDSVTLETVLAASPAYPWRIRLGITYRLEPTRFTVAFSARSEDQRPAPFGIGFHPYFLGDGPELAGASISVAASEHLRLDDRALPVGTEPIGGSPFAALATDDGLALGGVVLDDCFTGIARPDGALAVATYRPGPDRRPVLLGLGPSFTHLMCFTGDTLGSPRRRRALALEPMTCPPNAFATGDGVVTIDPGGSFADEFVCALG